MQYPMKAVRLKHCNILIDFVSYGSVHNSLLYAIKKYNTIFLYLNQRELNAIQQILHQDI